MHVWAVLCWGGAPPALLLYYFIILSLSLSRLGSLNSINWINFCWQQVLYVISMVRAATSHITGQGASAAYVRVARAGVSVLYLLTYLALPLSPSSLPTLVPHPGPPPWASCVQLSLILNPSNELASCTNIT